MADGCFMNKGKHRRWWTLEEANFLGYKQPMDKNQGKKPAECISLLGCFVDIPGAPSKPKTMFNIVPIQLGKDVQSFVVDSDRPEDDLQTWTEKMHEVVEACAAEPWAKIARKIQLQVWPEKIIAKDTKEEYSVFTFKITSSGGEWLFKQRFSGLSAWHEEVIMRAHGKKAPKFPAKHSMKKQNDKFLESRRLDLCRYFLQLLGVPGFLQSRELAILLDKKKNAALADKSANMAAIQSVPDDHADAVSFDVSKFDLPEEWISLNRAVVDRAGSAQMKAAAQHRLLCQDDEAWKLEDEQLNIAAYEMLFLTVGTSASLLSPRERETLEVVRTKLGITKRKMAETKSLLEEVERGSAADSDAAAESRFSVSYSIPREGYLDIMKGQKGQRRWFRLQCLEMKYYPKQGENSKELGLIDLEEAVGCRPAGGNPNTFLIELASETISLRASSDEECREWINCVHHALLKKRSAEAQEEDDYAAESIRLLEYRFRLLQQRTVSDFKDNHAFLSWRKRQIVLFASGTSHSINMYKACYNPYEVSLGGTQRKLSKQWDKLLKNSESDDDDYRDRLERLGKLVDDAYEVARRASDNDSYMEWYPFHVSTLLYERLLERSCFEDPDYGGELESNASVVCDLLKSMSSRLGFCEGMHDVCFALALVQLYNKTKSAYHLEQLESVVKKFISQPDALQFQCVQIQLQLLESFFENLLSNYHSVEDSSHLPHLVQCFMSLYSTKAVSGADMGDMDGILTNFIKSSVEVQYKNKRKELDEPGQEGLKDMEKLQRFLNVLQEEIDLELTEYSAYIGVHLASASAVAAETVAEFLNADLKIYFQDVTMRDAAVMDAWASLRMLEQKIVEAMESCDIAGSNAKVLKVDEAMESVAADWVKEQTEVIQPRIGRLVGGETWQPIDESQQMAASALDIVSMLMQVSRGYFQAELPVSETVMKQLAQQFGFLLQQYVRMVEQKCGDMPNIEGKQRRVQLNLESEDEDVNPRMGGVFASKFDKLQASKLARMAETASAAVKQALDEEIHDDAGISSRPANGPSLACLCVQLASVHYIIESCDVLLEHIIDGASSQNYTGASLDDALLNEKRALEEHSRAIAEHVGAHVIFSRLRSEVVDGLYEPTPRHANFGQNIDAIDVVHNEVMPNIPDKCHRDVLLQTLSCCVEAIEKRVRDWDSRLTRREAGVISLEDIDVVNEDLIQLREYFLVCGLLEEDVEKAKRKLENLWEKVAQGAREAPVMQAASHMPRSMERADASDGVVAADGFAESSGLEAKGQDMGQKLMKGADWLAKRAQGAADAAAAASSGAAGGGTTDGSAAQVSQGAAEAAAAAGEIAGRFASTVKSGWRSRMGRN